MADEQAKAGEDPAKVGLARKVALSYWTVTVAGLVVLAGHVRWYARGGPAAEVISGLGAALVVLGLWVAARPYIRAGVSGMVNQALPPYPAGPFHSEELADEHAALIARLRPKIVADVWAERVIAVGVIILGTLLNGYGPVIARGLHHIYLLHAKSMGHG